MEGWLRGGPMPLRSRTLPARRCFTRAERAGQGELLRERRAANTPCPVFQAMRAWSRARPSPIDARSTHVDCGPHNARTPWASRAAGPVVPCAE